MAADLIRSPGIPQNFLHDLESAFWVLLWMVLSFMKSSWDDGIRSSFLKGTMSPKVFHNTGGQDKYHFMQVADPMNIEIDNNPTLTSFLKSLKEILGVRHRNRPELPSPLDAAYTLASLKKDQSSIAQATATIKSQIKLYDDMLESLKTHDFVLHHFERALAEDWPADDKAVRQPLLLSNDVQTKMRSSTKRSVDVAGITGVYVSAGGVKKSKSGPL
jgi:hypothetical protein